MSMDPTQTALYVRALFGSNAVHVPATMYVQNQGNGRVSFLGMSRVLSDGDAPHPLRYGSDRTHQLIQGDLVIRPRLVIATDALRGRSLTSIPTNTPTLDDLLAEGLGEFVIGG